MRATKQQRALKNEKLVFNFIMFQSCTVNNDARLNGGFLFKVDDMKYHCMVLDMAEIFNAKIFTVKWLMSVVR